MIRKTKKDKILAKAKRSERELWKMIKNSKQRFENEAVGKIN